MYKVKPGEVMQWESCHTMWFCLKVTRECMHWQLNSDWKEGSVTEFFQHTSSVWRVSCIYVVISHLMGEKCFKLKFPCSKMWRNDVANVLYISHNMVWLWSCSALCCMSISYVSFILAWLGISLVGYGQMPHLKWGDGGHISFLASWCKREL